MTDPDLTNPDPDMRNEIEILPPAVVEVNERRLPGWRALAVTGVLAACLGALGGWAASQVTFHDTAAARSSDLDARIGATEAEMDAEADRLSARIDALEARPAPRAPDLSAIEARLESLETEPSNAAPTFPAIGTGGDVSPPAPALTPALTPALARRMADIESRLDRLEREGTASIRPATPRSTAPRPAPVQPATTLSAPAALPPFPFSAVEEALTENSGSLVGRFIRKRDARAADALDELREALIDNDLEAALDAYDDLPDDARDAAALWAAAAKERVR